MIDRSIMGMSWITLPKNCYEVVQRADKATTAQIELEINE